LWSIARPAYGDPIADEPVTLTWSAPEECPSAAEVSARAASRVPSGARVGANGRVEKSGGRYKLVLRIESRGERVLEAMTCDALASSAAVVLAMSVAPVKQKTETPAGSGAARDSSPSSASAEVARSASSSVRPGTEELRPMATDTNVRTHEQTVAAPERRFRSSAGARLHAIGDAGTLPAIGAGGGFAIGFDPVEALHMEATANFWAQQDGTLAANATRGAAFQLVTAGGRGCWVLTRPVTFAPCLGAEMIVLSGAGFGASRTSDARSVTWAPDVSFMVGVPLGDRFLLRAGLGIAAPVSRQAFVIAAGGEVHRPAFVAARAWIGPEIVF
jgi:hypothetical protein